MEKSDNLHSSEIKEFLKKYLKYRIYSQPQLKYYENVL